MRADNRGDWAVVFPNASEDHLALMWVSDQAIKKPARTRH
jgi:hypothetical protein